MMNIPYLQTINSVMYAIVCTMPNLAFAISVLSKFMTNLERLHLEALKWLWRCWKGFTNIGLVFEYCFDGVILEGFVDIDFV